MTGGKKLSQPSSKAQIDAFLQQASRTPASHSGGRLIFALDATASREATWDHASQLQAQMFQQTAALGGLHIQLCYYRGFGEFHASPWFGNTEQLLRQMTGVHCLAGHTQIEKLLRHAIEEARQHKVNALVFVGDCVEEAVDRLGQAAGELGLLGVPVFLFQEGHDPAARQAFQHIARLSGGAHCPFDAGSAQQLRDLLSAVAVYAAGGAVALEDFHRRHGKVVLRLERQQ
jgi:hypothetical protein